MRSRVIAAVAWLCLVAAPAAAELKYTMHLELKKGEAAAAANPMLAMMAQRFANVVPAGGADMIFIVGERGVRVEYVQAAMGQSAGTIVLARPTGDVLALNPADKTYWKVAMPDIAGAMAQAGMSPTTSTRRTGEFAEIAGVRAERVSFDWSADLPISQEARASLPPDFPTSLSMTGETWVSTDRYQQYAKLLKGNKMFDFLGALGLDKLVLEGIILRSIVRIAGVELHGEVTKIGEEDAAAALFDIPEGFKEVPPPQPVVR